jgi:D-glycero-alpha-D-manno-heptose-7-phosphate kinase
MIITQTPLRISFFGGGTDLKGFYALEEGCVLSSAIDKSIFVIIKRRFDAKVRVGYTRTELVDSIEELQHELVREALRLTGLCRQVEVGTMGDIPSTGSGLGSSSAVTVGLLNAIHTYLGQPQNLETLARQACRIEIDVLGKPIGKQDQYIAAYGGLRFIRFLPDEQVIVEEISLPEEERIRFGQQLMLFYTNSARLAETILAEQRAHINDRLDVLREMKEQAYQGRELLLAGDLEEFGHLMHRAWELKKQMATKITNPAIDDMYASARRAGAFGGKITGAGGGGFLLLFCPVSRQQEVRVALRGLRELPFRLEWDGTKTILNYRRS